MAKLLTPKGIIGYSSLRVAQGFKGAEENKKYSTQLIISGPEATEFIDNLEKQFSKLHAEEVERQKLKGGNSRFPAPLVAYKEPAPGSYQLNFSRKEVDGAPIIIDAEGNVFAGRVEKDTSAQLAFELKPWLMKTGTFGVTLRLVAVKIFGALTSEEVADLFGTPTPTKNPATTAASPKPEVDLQNLF